MIWPLLFFATVTATLGFSMWRRNRRNAQGRCAFCAAPLEPVHFRADGARVCARCAHRTKRNAYIALGLFAVIGLVSLGAYLFLIIRDWRQGMPPSLTTIGLALLTPLVCLGMWLWGTASMRGANRMAEEDERLEQGLEAIDAALGKRYSAESASASSATNRQSQN